MARTRRLTQLLEGAAARTRLPSGPIVVALSGGADSAALAVIARHLGSRIGLVHVNHGLEGSPSMGEAAREIAAALELPLEVFAVQVASGPSPEEQARQARYSALKAIDGAVLTAHTRDDNAETLLMNLMRGAGAAGLRGIPVFRPPNVHRPILEISRSETREIATLADLPFRDDPMNDDLTLTRNRVRRTLLPLMNEFNPRAVEAIARAATIVDADAALLDEWAPAVSARGVPIGLLATLPGPLADRLLAKLLEAHGVGQTADRLARMHLVASGSTERQDIAEGLSVRRRDAMLVIEEPLAGRPDLR